MKNIVALAALVCVVLAEAPSARQSAGAPNGPYKPSGWKPPGRQLSLPKQQKLPPAAYGPPKSVYGPPPTEETTTQQYEVVEPTEAPKQIPKPANLTEEKPSEKTYFIIVPQRERIVVASPGSDKVVYEVADAPKSTAFVNIPRIVVQEAPVAFGRLRGVPVPAPNAVYYPQPVPGPTYV